MTYDEFLLYKNQTLMLANGSNIHAINNQLGIIIGIIQMRDICDCEGDDKHENYDEIIQKAKHTICLLMKPY